jgi:hypothetical protein
MFMYLVPVAALTLGIPWAMLADGGASASVTISFTVVCVTFHGVALLRRPTLLHQGERGRDPCTWHGHA